MADLLRMDYINSLPQPFTVRLYGDKDWRWPIYDIEVQTGLVRIDACGKLCIKNIGDFKRFRDDSGAEFLAEAFYSDATPEERAPVDEQA